MNYRITHRTRYIYNEPVSLCHNEARLLPRETDGQQCDQCRLIIDPAPTDLRERLDYFGNRVVFFTIEHPHENLTVTASSEVSVIRAPLQLDDWHHIPWESVRDALHSEGSPEILEARQFMLDSPFSSASPEVLAYAETSFPAGRPMIDALEDLMHRIYVDFEFVPDATTVSTPLEEVLQNRKGVCQDFAQLGIGCLRSMGLAARYVSGYIETLPPPGRPKLQGADASHAWFAAWLPGLGWLEYDPTNDLIPEERHVVIGWGRDYGDVTPLKGVLFSSGEHEMTVSVDVEPI